MSLKVKEHKLKKVVFTTEIFSKSTKIFLFEHFVLKSGSDVSLTELPFSSQTSLVETPLSSESQQASIGSEFRPRFHRLGLKELAKVDFERHLSCLPC